MAIGIKTKVTCPKCRQSFVYTFIPGGSLHSVRLGKYRYMRCPKCKKWSIIDIVSGLDDKIVNHLSNSDIIAGAALVVVGLVTAFDLEGLVVLEVIGGIVVVIGILIIWLGLIIRRKGK